LFRSMACLLRLLGKRHAYVTKEETSMPKPNKDVRRVKYELFAQMSDQIFD